MQVTLLRKKIEPPFLFVCGGINAGLDLHHQRYPGAFGPYGRSPAG